MDRYHEAQLRDVLHNVYDMGAATIPWHLLYRWYGATRFASRSWADLHAKWLELLEDRQDIMAWRLGYIDTSRSDYLTLVCLDPADSKDSHFKPIDSKFKS